MRHVPVLIAAVVMLVTGPLAFSHGRDSSTGNLSIEVVSEKGSTFLSIPHQDFWKGKTHIIKRYLEARRGENYGIVIRNGTSERIGLVVAVDGRNIISGRKSELKNTEDMYVVNGYEHGRYDGWRTAKDKVNRFYFTDTADSYAMKTFNDVSSMGVIAVAVYREKERPKPLKEKKADLIPGAPSAGSPAGSKMEGTTNDATGTGFGDERYSPTLRVVFEPEDTPIQKTLVKYEWRDALCRKGILNCEQEPRNRLWEEDEYAPYPPGYSRK